MARYRDDRDEDDEDDRPRRRRPTHGDEADEERPRARQRSKDDEDEDEDRPTRRRRRAEEPKTSGSKTVVIVFSIIGAVFLLCAGGGFAFYWFSVKPVVDKVKESIDNAKSNANASLGAKRIGMGMHYHHDTTSNLPMPYHYEFDGMPPKKAPKDLSNQLSWRVDLLPYIEEVGLYKQFDLKSGWNSSQNQPLSTRTVKMYADYDTPSDSQTRWRMFYNNDAIVDSDPNKMTRFSSILDGTSNTILFVEGGEKVTWSQFNEYKYDPKGPLPAMGRPGTDRFLVVMADGSVKTVRKTVSENIFRAAITKSGGEVEAMELDR